MTTSPRSSLDLAGLRPEHVAFLGAYAAATPAKQVFVQMLCWPTVPGGWATLSQSSAALRHVRGGMAARMSTADGSWIHEAAPQLGLPLEGDTATAESTLATLMRRLPIRFAAAAVEHEGASPQGSEALRYRALFSESLGAYGTHLRETNQLACRVLVAPRLESSVNRTQKQVYDDVLSHLDGGAFLAPLSLAFWPDAITPLPLELAQLAAAAAGRYLLEPTRTSPLFETVRTLMVPSSRFHPHRSFRRRR